MIAGSAFPASEDRESSGDPQTPAAARPSRQEVDHVHDGDDPEHRERDTDPGGDVDDAEDGKREVIDPHAERDRNPGGKQLPRELRRRREPAEVVDGADDGRDGRAQENAASLAREVEERERRDDDPEEDREPAEPRNRPAVQAPRIGPVDGPEKPRHPTDRGREQDDDREGDRRSVQDLRRRLQLLEHHLTYFVPYNRSPASPRPGRM
jgi:hypothetical protein